METHFRFVQTGFIALVIAVYELAHFFASQKHPKENVYQRFDVVKFVTFESFQLPQRAELEISLKNRFVALMFE